VIVDNVAEICLVVPPFGSVHFPHLGTAVLKRACVARGLSSRIVYGNLRLAARIGIDRYDVVNDAPMRVMLGDRIFREHAYPSESLSRLPDPPPLREDLETLHKSIAGEIEPTLDLIVEEILALKPRIVGLSSTFQQNLACAAISLRIKQAAPEICVVMGGANAAWPICQGLAQAFPWIDHFFAGESDTDFPDFCERLIRNGERIDERIIQSEPIRDMRAVFAPVFDDYFATLRPLQAEGMLPDWLPRYLMAESSRGCWWGAKSHCTFCGLNGDGMQFRDKTAQHLREELEALAQWGVDMVYMADNIMPLNYLRNLFPALALIEPQVKLFYEVKANLSTANIDVLKRGGVVSIQPGIESR
jgi:ribosomal peptide maturation radical SAM protein 1